MKLLFKTQNQRLRLILYDKLKAFTPFTYMWFLKKLVDNPKTVLDLGCGDGKLTEFLCDGRDWNVMGVDIFKKNVMDASKKKIFKEVIKGDVVTVAKKLVRNKRKFDVVFCSQVIEHIERKRGEELLYLADFLAKKKIIISTPRGFMEEPEVFLGNNPHQSHKSGWNEDDFRKCGYKVYGVGFSLVWSERGLGRSHNRLVLIVAFILSFIFSPLVYYLPSIATGMLCIKEIKNVVLYQN